MASLVPAQHPDLLATPASANRTLGGEGSLKDVPVYRLRHRLWGQERTVVLFVSEQLCAGQHRGRPRATWQLEEAHPTVMAPYRAIVPDERGLGYTGAPV